MTTLNTRNFLKWTSIAINIENPTYNKSDCMKLAIKELQKEKKMRKYIHIRSIIQCKKLIICQRKNQSFKLWLSGNKCKNVIYMYIFLYFYLPNSLGLLIYNIHLSGAYCSDDFRPNQKLTLFAF